MLSASGSSLLGKRAALWTYCADLRVRQATPGALCVEQELKYKFSHVCVQSSQLSS